MKTRTPRLSAAAAALLLLVALLTGCAARKDEPAALVDPTPAAVAEPGQEAADTPAPEVTSGPAPVAAAEPAQEAADGLAPEVTSAPAPEVTSAPAPEVTAAPDPVPQADPEYKRTHVPVGRLNRDRTHLVFLNTDTGRYGLMDCAGNVLLEERWTMISPYMDGVALARRADGGMELIDADARTVLSFGRDVIDDAVWPQYRTDFYGFILRDGTPSHRTGGTEVAAEAADEAVLAFADDDPMPDLKPEAPAASGPDDPDSLAERGFWLEGRWARVKRNGRIGLMDTSGRIVIEPEWDEITRAAADCWRVKRDGLYGALDASGATIREPVWETLNCGGTASDGSLLPVGWRRNDFGTSICVFSRPDGTEVTLPVTVTEVSSFVRGWAVFTDKGKKGIISETGEILLSAEHDSVEIHRGTGGGFAVTDRHTVLDGAMREIGTLPAGADAILGVSRAWPVGDTGYTVWYIDCYYKNYTRGIAGFLLTAPDGSPVGTCWKDLRWDAEHGMLVGLRSGETDPKWYDTALNTLPPPPAAPEKTVPDYAFTAADGTRTPCTDVRAFREGYAAAGIASGGRTLYGYIDEAGNTVCEPVWDKCSDVSEGVGVITRDGKCGLIRMDGTVIVEPQVDWIQESGEIRLMRVADPQTKKELWGFVRADGTVVSRMQWTGALGYRNGLAFVTADRDGFGGSGTVNVKVLDTDGRIVGESNVFGGTLESYNGMGCMITSSWKNGRETLTLFPLNGGGPETSAICHWYYVIPVSGSPERRVAVLIYNFNKTHDISVYDDRFSLLFSVKGSRHAEYWTDPGRYMLVTGDDAADWHIYGTDGTVR